MSLNKLGIILGILFSVVYAAFSLGTWHAGVNAYVAFLPYATFVWAPLTVVLLIAGGLTIRKGHLPFVKALQYAFLAYILYELGYAAVNIIIYNVLDKSWGHQVTMVSLQNLAAKSAKLGLPMDQINDSLAQEQKTPTGPLTFLQVLIGLGQGLLWDFVKSMIVALLVQKKA
ncbi:DUF4199 domain-containing protein [Dinghuibacter silviterrae]|uniref:Uncharacterized protein DUF4199 n=1 Tax=Dinghuibacter silviterrae TaxID=1539049 RepID=A0A4R8DVS4_9BACT|nr:DUF4199 domain-containing protein [Dinghuibacter silviterrae]TDX02309.1 uncharacterized protein DUF4199 [Dinghuibacter silviterrae]